MIEMEQAIEASVHDQQTEQTSLTVVSISRVGEDMDIEYWTLLEEARIVG